MSSLPKKIMQVHHALRDAELPHAFGGALALAWCTQRARGTIDIDLNVFVDAARCREVCAALPKGVSCDDKQLAALERDGQVRLWWGTTPVDLFLDTTPFHQEVMGRRRWERFGGEDVPFLSCHDIAVFKVFFNRTKDWADLEEMQAAGTLDIARVAGVLVEYLGVDDERVRRLSELNTATGKF